LTESRARLQREFIRALSTKRSRKEQLSLAWEVWSSKESKKFLWMFFESYALAMRDRKRFPGFLERLVKDWLRFFEQAVAAAGVEAERVQPVATFILATIRGLQLDLIASDERARVDGAFGELLHLLALRSNNPNIKRRSTVERKEPTTRSKSTLAQKLVNAKLLRAPR
jgi:hypothetical protein